MCKIYYLVLQIFCLLSLDSQTVRANANEQLSWNLTTNELNNLLLIESSLLTAQKKIPEQGLVNIVTPRLNSYQYSLNNNMVKEFPFACLRVPQRDIPQLLNKVREKIRILKNNFVGVSFHFRIIGAEDKSLKNYLFFARISGKPDQGIMNYWGNLDGDSLVLKINQVPKDGTINLIGLEEKDILELNTIDDFSPLGELRKSNKCISEISYGASYYFSLLSNLDTFRSRFKRTLFGSKGYILTGKRDVHFLAEQQTEITGHDSHKKSADTAELGIGVKDIAGITLKPGEDSLENQKNVKTFYRRLTITVEK